MLRSYTPADLLTLANASCGTLSVFACLSYIADDRSRQVWAAFVLPVFALVFDVLDGYVARMDTRRQSRLGADLDSLAVLTFFVCCGAREARQHCLRVPPQRGGRIDS